MGRRAKIRGFVGERRAFDRSLRGLEQRQPAQRGLRKEEPMAVKPIPEGYRTYTPYYVVDGASEFIDFLKKAFGAEETFRMPAPGNRIGHAEIRIGDSMIMLADQNQEHGSRQMNGHLYVTDV